MKIIKLAFVLIASIFLVMILKQFEHVENHSENHYVVDNDYNRLFNDDIKHRIVIEISSDEFQGMSDDMLTYSRYDNRMRTGNYREATFTYYDEYGEVTSEMIGIRTKGNTSRVLPIFEGVYNRAHFKLKFNETFDHKEGSDDYIELDSRRLFGMSELILKSNMDFDPSYIHELFGYKMQKEIGLKAPSVTLTTLEFIIDGEVIDYGVYTVIENIDGEFLTRNYSDAYDDGNLYKCLWQDHGPAILEPINDKYQVGIKSWEDYYRPTYDLKTNKKNPNHSELLSFIDNINELNGDDYINYLDDNFEVDNYLKSTILNVFMGMPDDYWAMGNNYFLYFTPEGKVEFFQIDYDNSLGSGWEGWGYSAVARASAYTWNDLVSRFIGLNKERALIEKMLKEDVYKEKYALYLEEINEVFTYDAFLEYYEWAIAMYGEDALDEYPFALSSEEEYFEIRKNSILMDLRK
jgi:spore coat protein CotH